MSHVLDRMIRRTRTAAPAVEPLYQPRYQPHTRAYTGMHATAEGAESFLDVAPESTEFIETNSRSAEARSAAGAAAYPATGIDRNRAAQLFEAGGQILSAAERDGKSAGRGRLGGYRTSGLREGTEGEGIEAREIGAADAAEATKREGDRTRSIQAAMQVAAREEPRRDSGAGERSPIAAQSSGDRGTELCGNAAGHHDFHWTHRGAQCAGDRAPAQAGLPSEDFARRFPEAAARRRA